MVRLYERGKTRHAHVKKEQHYEKSPYIPSSSANAKTKVCSAVAEQFTK